ALADNAHDLGEKEGGYAGVNDQTVEHDFGDLAVVGAAGTPTRVAAPALGRPAALLGPAGDQLGENAAHKRERHDRAQDARGPRAAKAAEALDEERPGSVACGGHGCADPARTAAKNEHVGFRDHGKRAGGLFIKTKNSGGTHALRMLRAGWALNS